ncbi:hypothetical protein [Aeoliella mucimassa]|uniref:Uncharacterized protein n=1 Tax=Aeoliella mucimassa TaxID=2527972 RepID=A0A518AVY2_9BACT|nr:hypothetical protein [Aeoliella mucimassa]QDU58907.1 hypothetical protein Pan181_51480 [Aeoliella mucimassa]
MKLPRFRVRALLVTTTIAAVLVACLAPWLREVDWLHALQAVPLRIACILVGCIPYGLGTLWKKQWGTAPPKPEEVRFVVRRRLWQFINVFSLVCLLVMAAYVLHWDLAPRVNSLITGRVSQKIACLLWVNVGFMVPMVIDAFRNSLKELQLTDEGVVSFPRIWRWKELGGWHWLDRKRGVFTLTWKGSVAGNGTHQVAPEQVDALDAFLRGYLQPELWWSSSPQDESTVEATSPTHTTPQEPEAGCELVDRDHK